VDNQSERQRGAFTFLYLVENRKACDMPDESSAGRRNKVIHKGFIESRASAIAIANRTISFIKDRIKELGANNPRLLEEFNLARMDELKEKHKDKPNVRFLSVWTILTESYKAELGKEFNCEQYLKTVKAFRDSNWEGVRS
jgi:hypothetical protein